MNLVDKAVQFMVDTANDSSHGYDQSRRWGPDYDCSSLVITAYQNAGAGVKAAGATYTGNMYSVFTKCGFKDVTSSVSLQTGGGLVAGDVLLHHQKHTAMYIGNGKLAQASINERGTVTGGKSGDQTGGEINIKNYYNFPWQCVLRYVGGGEAADHASDKPFPNLEKGAENKWVGAMQALLIAYGYSCGPDGIDNCYGPSTTAAVLKYQKDHGLEQDGKCGPKTWASLRG